MGASQLEHAEPPWQFTRMAALSYCTLDLLLGAHMGLEGEHVYGVSTRRSQWAAKSELGPHDRSVLSSTGSSPGQTTLSHVGTSTVNHMDAIKAASMPESYWLCQGGI
jgi:hypothetical protein